MLNELSELSRSLSRHKIEAPRWHPWIEAFKKGDALVARISGQGSIASVAFIPAEQLANLRNIAPDNQKSFPGFNLKCPLLCAEAKSASFPQLTDAKHCKIAYEPTDLQRLKRLLVEFPQQILRRIQHAADGKLLATRSLLERMTAHPIDPEEFLRQLVKATVDGAQQGRIDEDYAASILYGKPNKGKQKLDAWQATLILEIVETGGFSHGIADASVAAGWSEALFASESPAAPTDAAVPFRCALTGALDSPVGTNSPIQRFHCSGRRT